MAEVSSTWHSSMNFISGTYSKSLKSSGFSSIFGSKYKYALLSIRLPKESSCQITRYSDISFLTSIPSLHNFSKMSQKSQSLKIRGIITSQHLQMKLLQTYSLNEVIRSIVLHLNTNWKKFLQPKSKNLEQY